MFDIFELLLEFEHGGSGGVVVLIPPSFKKSWEGGVGEIEYFEMEGMIGRDSMQV